MIDNGILLHPAQKEELYSFCAGSNPPLSLSILQLLCCCRLLCLRKLMSFIQLESSLIAQSRAYLQMMKNTCEVSLLNIHSLYKAFENSSLKENRELYRLWNCGCASCNGNNNAIEITTNKMKNQEALKNTLCNLVHIERPKHKDLAKIKCFSLTYRKSFALQLCQVIKNCFAYSRCAFFGTLPTTTLK